MRLNNLVTHRLTPANVQQFIANSLIAIGLLLLLYYLQIYQPVGYIFFVSEDSWSEYVTFVLWSMTAAMLGWLLVRHPEFRKPGYFAFAGAAFLIAMEEISWGQRLFGLPTLDVFADWNVQGELNLHNMLLPDQFQAHLGIGIILAVVVTPVATRLFPPLARGCTLWGIPLVPIWHWPLFAIPLFFQYEDRLFRRFDSGFMKHGLYVGYDGELSELGLAIATTVFVTSLIFKSGSTRLSPPYKPIVVTVATLIFAVSLGAPLVHYFPSPGSLQWGFNTAANRIYPRVGLYSQAEVLFEYMRRHPQFSEEDSGYYHGLVLFKLGQKKEAKDILEQFLIQQSSVFPSHPHSSNHFRTLGKTLHALGRLPEACQAYRHAFAWDSKKISKGDDDPNRRWGLAKTFFAMGQWDAATKQIDFAVRAAPSRKLKQQILRWHYVEKSKAFQARLLPDIISPKHPACITELNSLVTIDYE